MKYVLFVFWILIIIVGITFASLNSRIVTVNYYLSESTMQLPFLLLIVLTIGVLLGIIALLPSLIRNKHANRRLKYRIKQIEQEVNNLRTIPIKEIH